MKFTSDVIHLVWTGPFSIKAAKEYVKDTDFGIYQIYGAHPVNGSNVLLYIGRARGGTFGWRIPKHQGWLERHGDVWVYLGRIAGQATPSNDVWNREIDLAELLLIYAHQPIANELKSLGTSEADVASFHVCNWGRKADLMPEVSGLRWTADYSKISGSLYRDGAYVAPSLEQVEP